jgi:hypothetical protein
VPRSGVSDAPRHVRDRQANEPLGSLSPSPSIREQRGEWRIFGIETATRDCVANVLTAQLNTNNFNEIVGGKRIPFLGAIPLT